VCGKSAAARPWQPPHHSIRPLTPHAMGGRSGWLAASRAPARGARCGPAAGSVTAGGAPPLRIRGLRAEADASERIGASSGGRRGRTLSGGAGVIPPAPHSRLSVVAAKLRLGGVASLEKGSCSCRPVDGGEICSHLGVHCGRLRLGDPRGALGIVQPRVRRRSRARPPTFTAGWPGSCRWGSPPRTARKPGRCGMSAPSIHAPRPRSARTRCATET
jgi:hypothetical protein